MDTVTADGGDNVPHDVPECNEENPKDCDSSLHCGTDYHCADDLVCDFSTKLCTSDTDVIDKQQAIGEDQRRGHKLEDVDPPSVLDDVIGDCDGCGDVYAYNSIRKGAFVIANQKKEDDAVRDEMKMTIRFDDGPGPSGQSWAPCLRKEFKKSNGFRVFSIITYFQSNSITHSS